MVALGLVSGEHAYLQSSWNILDGVLVLVSLVDIVVAMASAGGAKILGILRVLRLLRTLRPLRWMGPRGGAKGAGGGRGRGRGGAGPRQERQCWAPPGGSSLGRAQQARSFWPSSRVISRAPGLKLVVETLISSLRPIGNIVLICCAFFIIFGILGVQVRGLPV